MTGRLPGLVLASLLAGGSAAAQGATPPDSLALCRQYAQWFFTGQMDSVLAHTAPDARADQTKDVLLQRLEQMTMRGGTEVEVLEEKFVKRNGRTQYWRTSKFSDFEEPLLFRWALDPQLQIIGMGMGPKSQAPPIDPS
ncbi:MAG: hypothetical protein ACREMR_07275 [Gemmatimonadales bacterium]